MDSENKIVIYQTEDNQTQVDVRLDEETVWLSLNHLVELFDRDKSVISRHLRNIFQEGELSRNSTVAKFATVQNEGGRSIERNIEFFNLDVIISVGYRVKSKRGTQFRIWANNDLLTTLTLLIAISNPQDKDLLVNIVSVILQRNI